MNKKVKSKSKNDGFKLSKGNEIIILIILFFLAFTVRMATYDSIFVGDKIRLLEFDTYYHMRRVVSFADNFPHIWDFDTYLDYPYGNVVGWPFLYDWIIALVANIIGFGHPSQYLTESTGVYFPVFIGSLSVVVIYFLSKEIFFDIDKKWQIGFIGGLFLTILPAFVQVSFLGFVDHHVAEVLLSLTIYLFLLKSLRVESFKNRIIFLSLAGFVLILALFTWAGSPIFIGIILIYYIIQNIIDKKYRNLFAMIGILSILYIVMYLLFPETYQFLSSGLNFLTKEGLVLQQIQETQSLFFTFGGKFTSEPSWNAFNITLYLAIIGMSLLMIKIVNHSLRPTSARIMFLTWTSIVLVLNLYQMRFVYLFAANVAILSAYLIVELINSNKIYIQIAGVCLFVPILIFSYQMDNNMAREPLMLSNDWFVSLEWLKNNTPDPDSDWSLPSKDKIPNYGVMSWWDYGNYILYLSQRPVVANNFQLGVEDLSKFLTSENESDANNIIDKRKVRYVIVDYRSGLNFFRSGGNVRLRGVWMTAARLSGKNPRYYLDKNNLPNQNYFNTTYAKLYLYDGKGLNNYKLIYKSQTRYPDIFNRPIEEIKIFEYIGNDR